MTRTMKTGTGNERRTGTKRSSRRRVAVTGGLGVALLALAAVPAQAKGSLDLTAPRTATVGKAFTVTAQGNDDAAPYQRICLEDRNGAQAWRQLACGTTVAREDGGDVQATAQVKAAQRGPLQLRAVLYGMTGPSDQHPVRYRASDVATVQVR
ncbi:hypothetical protein [Streptomyces sp. NPDC052496]|uniref:hypothetical protein n=1 Tax=Streptomyces sp. NPDC052496 TaxID=3154951 RepID=UPI003417AC14